MKKINTFKQYLNEEDAFDSGIKKGDLNSLEKTLDKCEKLLVQMKKLINQAYSEADELYKKADSPGPVGSQIEGVKRQFMDMKFLIEDELLGDYALMGVERYLRHLKNETTDIKKSS